MGSRPLDQVKIGLPLRLGGNWSLPRLNGTRPESPSRSDFRFPAFHIGFHTPLSKDLSNETYVSFGRQLQAAGLTFEEKKAAVWSILSSFLYVGNSGVETNLSYADVQEECDASGTGCVFAMDSNTLNLNSPVMYFPTRGEQPWWRWISDLSNNLDTFGTLYQIIGWAIEYYQTFPERIPQGLFSTPPGSNSPALPPSVPRPIPAAPPSLPPAASPVVVDEIPYWVLRAQTDQICSSMTQVLGSNCSEIQHLGEFVGSSAHWVPSLFDLGANFSADCDPAIPISAFLSGNDSLPLEFRDRFARVVAFKERGFGVVSAMLQFKGLSNQSQIMHVMDLIE